MAVPRRVRRFINAGVPVTLDCTYAKSNANNKGIARSPQAGQAQAPAEAACLADPNGTSLSAIRAHEQRRAPIWPSQRRSAGNASSARRQLTPIRTFQGPRGAARVKLRLHVEALSGRSGTSRCCFPSNEDAKSPVARSGHWPFPTSAKCRHQATLRLCLKAKMHNAAGRNMIARRRWYFRGRLKCRRLNLP
jgi:hypothetical protein